MIARHQPGCQLYQFNDCYHIHPEHQFRFRPHNHADFLIEHHPGIVYQHIHTLFLLENRHQRILGCRRIGHIEIQRNNPCIILCCTLLRPFVHRSGIAVTCIDHGTIRSKSFRNSLSYALSGTGYDTNFICQQSFHIFKLH